MGDAENVALSGLNIFSPSCLTLTESNDINAQRRQDEVVLNHYLKTKSVRVQF